MVPRMHLDRLPLTALAARRARLAAALPDAALVFASGRSSPRNYADNAFPYRAASHFLYLVGAQLESSFLTLRDGRFTLFARAPTATDLLWDGPSPSLAALSERLGIEVQGLDRLEAHLASRNDWAALPTPDALGCKDLSRLLGRAVRPGVLAPRDEPLADAMIALRLVHDEAALQEFRAGAAITHEVHLAGMGASAPGRTEAQVRAAMEYEALARDVPLAYQPIVSVHGEVLHSHTYRNPLSEGDLLLADVGAESPGGWATDVTRTWPVSGRFSSTQRAFYDVVLAAQLAAIDRVRPGVRYLEVHLTAARELARGLCALGVLRGDPEELVADGVVGLLFPHGIGHLMGLDVHDMEDLGDRAGYAPGRTRSTQFGLRSLRLDRDLEPGMVVTIEPGLYLVPAILGDVELTAAAGDRLDRQELSRFADVRGIRIEDDVAVTRGEPEVLTASIPKRAEEVEALVGRSTR